MPNSSHLMDPELALALDGVPPFDYTAESIGVMRPLVAAMSADAPPAPGVITREEVIDGPEGNKIRLLVSEPADGPRTGAMLWLHGGGQIVGSSDGYAAQNRYLAQQTGAIIIAVDYRLAPEDPYPAGLEDCYSVLRWAHESAAAWGIPTERIAVAGESGGGGLAAGLTFLAQDRGELPVSAQFLLYPMLDDRTGTPAEPDPWQLAAEPAAPRPHQRGAGTAQLRCERDQTPDVSVGDVAEDADHEDDVGRHRAAVRVDAAGIDGAHLHLSQPGRSRGITRLLRKVGLQLEQHRRHPLGVVAVSEHSQHISTISRAKAQDARLAQMPVESVPDVPAYLPQPPRQTRVRIVVAMVPVLVVTNLAHHLIMARWSTGTRQISATPGARASKTRPAQPGQMNNRRLQEWLRAVDQTSTWTASVCTGSLILAAAGLLVGRRATTRWLAVDQLALLGATPVDERVVIDGHYVTGAGVSAGIDMALTLAGRLAGDHAAQLRQLSIEYSPQPPYQAGFRQTAPSAVVGELLARRQQILPASPKPDPADLRVRFGGVRLGGSCTDERCRPESTRIKAEVLQLGRPCYFLLAVPTVRVRV